MKHLFLSLLLLPVACLQQHDKSKGASGGAEAHPQATATPTPGTDASATPPAAAAGKNPIGCGTIPTPAADDLVLFNGESLSAGATNTLRLTGGWLGDEVWDNGKLVFESSDSSIRFGNEGIYHGFKLSPPLASGKRRTFTVKGAEVTIEAVRGTSGALPTFGLRVIKPDEFEGNGGAATTTWMLDKADGGSRFLNIPAGCTTVFMWTPQAFVDQKAIGNRFIWEMQSNWNQADQLHIRRIALKGFVLNP